jgi:hypothetical protein
VAHDDLDRFVDDYVAGLLKRSSRSLQWTKMAVNAQMKQIVWPALESGLKFARDVELSRRSRRGGGGVQ